MKRSVSFFVLFFFVWSFHIAYGALLYLDPNQAEMKRGDTLKVSVRLDTDEGECINAVDGVITYTENIQPVDISRGNSIMSMWVEDPKIDKQNRTITFAGGIPNGYCGRIPGDPRLTNNVVDLLFQSPGLQIGSTESGNEVKIDFAPQTSTYRNDGFGTQASTTLLGAKIVLAREVGATISNDWQEIIQSDTIPPEPFSITIERTTNAFSNNYFITFNTTDKQSGIDHYEVIEEPLASQQLFTWGAETAPWRVAKSPYVLDDQSLNSTIRVKAFDKAGNEYIAALVPDKDKRGISRDRILTIAVLTVGALALIGIFAFFFFYIRKRRKAQSSESVVQETGFADGEDRTEETL